LPGCTAEQTEDGNGSTPTGSGREDDRTLSVATYSSFVDAPSDSPGEWIKEEFEARHDVEFEWVIPDSPINHYIERHNQGVDIDAEVYMGIKPNELVRVDENTDGELFQPVDESALEHAENIGDEFRFDPQGRDGPAYSSYAALVYDGRTLEKPETFEDLLADQLTGNLAVSNPRRREQHRPVLPPVDDPRVRRGGRVHVSRLLERPRRERRSDPRLVGDAYAQFDEGEIPAVFSYSNDRVYAKRFGNDLDKHQVSLLNGQGYANLNAMGRFAQGTDDDLAREFMSFVLDPEVQAKIAELNVTGPVNTETVLPDVYREFAQEPDDVVFFDYDELRGNVDGWIEAWEREIVGDR